MKAINKTLIRDIKSHLSYYVATTIITALAIFFVVITFSAADMVGKGMDEIMQEGNVEDAQFMTFIPLSSSDIGSLESEYDCIIEESSYFDIDSDGKTIRFFRPMEKINLRVVLEGKDIGSEDIYNLLIDRDFSEANDVVVGDNIAIEDIICKVCGLAVRPDYLYSLKNLTDPWIDKQNFCLAFPCETLYNEVYALTQGTENRYYSVKYLDYGQISAFRKCLHDDYGACVYLSSESNPRIEMPHQSRLELVAMAACFGPIIFIVAMLLISMVLGRTMDREKKQFGTLMSFGYTRREICMHYIGYTLFPAIIGSIAGILSAGFSGEGIAMYFVVDYQKINYDYVLTPWAVIIGLLLPALLYAAVAYLKARSFFGSTIVSLLLNRDSSSSKSVHLFEHLKIRFGTKHQLRELVSHFWRTLLVLACLFFSSYLCLIGLTFQDSAGRFIHEGVTGSKVYQNTYYLNVIMTDNNLPGDKGLAMTYEHAESHHQIEILGMPDTDNYRSIDFLEGSFSPEGVYITNAVAVEYGLHKGDSIYLLNSVTLEPIKAEINGVTDDNSQQAVVTSLSKAVRMLNLKDGIYNVILSDTELDIPSDKLAYQVDNDDVLKTLEQAIKAMDTFVYGLIFIGCVLSVLSIYLVSDMLISDNRKNISIFKVLGYRRREINNMFLGTNHWLLLLAFILSVPCCLATLGVFGAACVSLMHIVLKPFLSIKSICLSCVLILISYCFALLLLRKKADCVDLVLALKDDRE